MAPPPALDATLGALEIGAMFSTFLFGLVTIQAFTYFSKHSGHDSWKLKALVAFICTMEFVHTVLVVIFIYGRTITSFGDFQKLVVAPTELGLSIAVTGFIGPTVQAFYAFRILKLSGRRLIPILCWGISVLRFGVLLSCSIASLLEPNIFKFQLRFWGLVVTSIALSATADAIIAVSTCYYLWNQRSGAFQRTQNMVDKMIFWTIQTGFLTSMTTITMLIVILTMNNFVWVALLLVASRSFSNSLLSTLNSRTSIRQAGRTTSFVEMPTTFRSRVQEASPSGVHIEMSKTRKVTVEE